MNVASQADEYGPKGPSTADLCDIYVQDPVDVVTQPMVSIVAPLFRDFGGVKRFCGQVTTLKVYENNPLVRQVLSEPGSGRVLVVDGGGSLRCALLGDQIAGMACTNKWNGVIINGCIRDSAMIGAMPIGVKALSTCPLKSSKRDKGLRDVDVNIGGTTFRPGGWVYADQDGILVAPQELTLPDAHTLLSAPAARVDGG